MNYTLQLHGERVLYPVPPGLPELMSDVSREVLRAQPTHLYRFIADYLDTLVRVRTYVRSADSLVSEVLARNTELMALVGSLGASWDDVNAAATRVQRAYRCYVARRELKKKLERRQLKAKALRASESSESFREFLYSLNYSPDDVSADSTLLLEAYDKFMNQKGEVSQKPAAKDFSVGTVDVVPVQTKRDNKRDSKLQVYEQSPQGSLLSSWSLLAREQAIKDAEQKRADREMLVYEQTPAPEIPGSRYKKITSKTLTYSIDSQSFTSDYEGRHPLPKYYDETQPKIPMISQSGKLEDEGQDIVTLYSTDSVDDDNKSKSETFVSLASVSNLPRGRQLAQELYDIIDQRSDAPKTAMEASKVIPDNSRIDPQASKAITGKRSLGSQVTQQILEGSKVKGSHGAHVAVSFANQEAKLEAQPKVHALLETTPSKRSKMGSLTRGSKGSWKSRRSKKEEEN